mmetsp:Transcript_21941/g.36148  ORF Transcript_21941/g.36148 Transcript_21941/m.36148 type:complete len:106 (+) Transcript_21941:78-395(+)
MLYIYKRLVYNIIYMIAYSEIACSSKKPKAVSSSSLMFSIATWYRSTGISRLWKKLSISSSMEEGLPIAASLAKDRKLDLCICAWRVGDERGPSQSILDAEKLGT